MDAITQEEAIAANNTGTQQTLSFLTNGRLLVIISFGSLIAAGAIGAVVFWLTEGYPDIASPFYLVFNIAALRLSFQGRHWPRYLIAAFHYAFILPFAVPLILPPSDSPTAVGSRLLGLLMLGALLLPVSVLAFSKSVRDFVNSRKPQTSMAS